MNIDWSKAPKGATHYGPAVAGKWLACWHKNVNGQWLGWLEDGDFRWGMSGNLADRINQFIARPAWGVEGLPPAGTVCEMRRTDYVDVDWQRIEFLCAGSKKAFFRDGEGHEWSRPLSYLKFRPIRTPEQIEEEKRDNAAAEMAEATQGAKDWHDAFRMLHNAGYRKQVRS